MLHSISINFPLIVSNIEIEWAPGFFLYSISVCHVKKRQMLTYTKYTELDNEALKLANHEKVLHVPTMFLRNFILFIWK